MSGQYIDVDTDKLNHSRIRVPKPNKKHLVTLPKRLQQHIKLHATSGTHANALHALFTKTYNHQTQLYALTYHIPLVQLSSEDIDETHHNHMYVHLCMTGKYERHNLHNHIRVNKLSVCVVVLPVFMTAEEQASLLLNIPANHDLSGHLRTHNLHFVETHSIESVNQAYEHSVSPTAQSYVETSVKSQHLRQMEQQALAVGSHIQTYDRLPKGTDREPGKVLKQLKYHYGPNVVVKELDKTMHVLEDGVSTVSTTHKLPNLTHTTPTTIRMQLQHHPMESYINNKSKLAVVAVLPQMHLTHQFHIVAVALFEFVPAVLVARAKRTSRHKSQRAHIVLQHLLVDHRYDEYVLDPKQRRASNGIRQQLVQSALPYSQTVFGPHDVYYTHQHKPTYRALLTSGFAKERPAKTLTHRVKMTLKRRRTPLKYTAKAITCSSWEECKELVREKYPNMPLKDVLVMASDLCPSSQGKTAPTTPKRSRRPVSAKQGAKILQEYYTQKLLVPAGVSLELSKKEVESAMADEEKAQAIQAYCKTIRNHLRRTRKHTVLTIAKKNTWKYRPDPNEDITPESYQGPDKYVLEELDATHELGEELVKRPMGRSTPTVLRSE